MPNPWNSEDDETRSLLEGLNRDEIELYALLSKQNKSKVTKTLKKLAKEEFGDQIEVPELELESKIEELRKTHEEKFSELEKSLNEKVAAPRLERMRESLKDRGYTDENIETIEAMIQDKRVKSYQDAITLFEAEREIVEPEPAPSYVPRWELPIGEGTKMEDIASGRHAQEVAHGMIDEYLRKNRTG